MRHKDLEVVLQCDGHVLDEYATEIDGERITCYVASEAGKAFKIRCSNHSPSTCMSLFAMADGRAFPHARCCEAGTLDSTIDYRDSADGVRTLLFSPVRHTDDEAALQNMANIDKIGSIELRVLRSQQLTQTPYKSQKKVMQYKVGALHESAKKTGLHCVSVGKMKACPAKPLTRVRLFDTKANPYITFHFYYRPREMLRAQGVDVGPELLVAQPPPVTEVSSAAGRHRTPSPRSATPDAGSKRSRLDEDALEVLTKRSRQDADTSSGSPGGEAEDVKPHVQKDEPDEDGDSEASLRAIRAQMRALQEQLDRIESKKKRPDCYGSVKRERSPIRAVHIHGAIIDLTDD